MKRSLIAAAVIATSIPAMAQFFGVPVAETASPSPQGTFTIGGGATFGEYDDADITMYGGRVGYNVIDGLKIFGDIGMVEVEDADAEPAFQGGVLYALPLQGDIPLAIRGTVGLLSYEEEASGYEDGYQFSLKSEVDFMAYTLCLLSSMQIDALSVYGGIGFAHVTAEATLTASLSGYGSESESDDDSETDALLFVGAKYPLAEGVSLYGEVVFIDGLNVGGGVMAEF